MNRGFERWSVKLKLKTKHVIQSHVGQRMAKKEDEFI